MIRRSAISCGAALIGAVLSLTPVAVRAELSLPTGAQVLSVRETPLGTYALPLGPAEADEVPFRALEGRILRRTWRVRTEATVLQLLAPMRAQLLEEGYDPVFQCEARICGGFDFRFGIEVVPAPDMAVSIGDYHFLSAVKGDRAVSLLVSHSGASAYIQLIEVSPPDAGPLQLAQTQTEQSGAGQAAGAAGQDETDLADQLLSRGHVVLQGLDFGTGDGSLGQESYDSLTALAAFLADYPQYSVVVVGHTDTVGGLEDNLALSRRRAEAVRDHLVRNSAVAEGRVQAVGVGYLAPVSSNLTAVGQEANRRVEAVLLPKPGP